MQLLLVLCLALAANQAQGFFSHGLRVKWGAPVLDSFNKFFDIPRQRAQAIAEGWQKTERADTRLASLVMYCPKDDLTFCALYDNIGYIAGIQISLPSSFISVTPLESLGFTLWNAPDGNQYHCNYQYFISEATLKKSPEERMAARKFNENTLQENAIWIPGFDGELLKISAESTDIEKSIFTKQACIVTMGLHYYYDMKPEMDCEKLFPWFLLVNDGKLQATGFVALGKYPLVASGKRMWFEQPPKLAVQVIVPRGPKCLYDLSGEGIVTMHIYYDKHPNTIGC